MIRTRLIADCLRTLERLTRPPRLGHDVDVVVDGAEQLAEAEESCEWWEPGGLKDFAHLFQPWADPVTPAVMIVLADHMPHRIKPGNSWPAPDCTWACRCAQAFRDEVDWQEHVADLIAEHVEQAVKAAAPYSDSLTDLRLADLRVHQAMHMRTHPHAQM